MMTRSLAQDSKPQIPQQPQVDPKTPPKSAEASKYGPTSSTLGAAVYFIDLKDGATIQPKTVLHFGLRNMSVAPAGSDMPNAGHHHLLIDTELPPLNEPIPNDFNHLHFGAGQTEAEIELDPGEHTLQLLLGDKNHIPMNPPVMSERIKVKVAAPAPAPAPETAYQREPSPRGSRVYFISPRNGAFVRPTFTVRFGVVGMDVAPAGTTRPKSGHHHLLIDTELPPPDTSIPNDFNHLHFGGGQTEAEVTLPAGRHKLQLLFADANHVPQDPPLFSAPIEVTVIETGKRPHPFRHRHHRTYNH